MPTGSNAFYSQQYATAVELLAQQMVPKIAGTFTPMTAVGRAATVVNLIEAFAATERTGLYEDITFTDVSHTRPWVYPRHFDSAVPFDSIEQMQMNANPSSEYVMGVVAALNRQADDECISKFFASRNIGENGTASDSFAAARQIGVDVGGTASGLNVEKLQTVLRFARQLELMDGEVVNIAISPVQEQNLMNEIEVTSSDFTVKGILDKGTIAGSNYMGFNWIIHNRLTTDGSGYRRVPVWTNKGMAYCTWDGGIKTDVSQRKDKAGLPWQVYGQGHFGAVRRDANKVFEIKCAE
jgi:hypothetical protein